MIKIDHYYVENGYPPTQRREARTLAEAVAMARETPDSIIEPRDDLGSPVAQYRVYSPKHPVSDVPLFRMYEWFV